MVVFGMPAEYSGTYFATISAIRSIVFAYLWRMFLFSGVFRGCSRVLDIMRLHPGSALPLVFIFRDSQPGVRNLEIWDPGFSTRGQ